MHSAKTGATLARSALGLTGVGITSMAAMTGAHSQQVALNAANANTVETVVVTGRVPDIAMLPAKILDTPQSINVIPTEVIKEQGINNLQDALKNVPGITLNAGEGGTHGDLVNLRGFSAGDDYFMDGLRDTGLYDRDTFDYESIEVYKGPASTLFGRGSTGGVINQVLKTPQLFPIDDFAVTGGSNGEVRGTADLNAVIGDDAAVRLNVMGQRNNQDGRPFARNQRFGVAPSIAFGLGTDTTFMLKYLHQQEDNIPDYGIPFLFDKPAPVARDTYYGLPSDDRFQTEVDVVTGRVEHKFDDTWSISDTARYGHYWFDSRQTAAIYGSANCFASAATAGFFSGAPLCAGLPAAQQMPVTFANPYFPVAGTPASAVLVQRDRPSSKGTIATLMNDLNATARFATGPLDHTVVIGVQYDNESADLARFANQNTVIAATPLLAPDPFEAFPGRQTTVKTQPITKTNTAGLYVTDTVTWGPHWALTAALRYDHFNARFDQAIGTAQHFSHTDEIVSPRAALVYKPTPDSSLYVSYGTSFNPSAENLALSASNQALPPEKDRTFEIGGKAQVLDGLLSLTAALFNTQMTNARITDPTNPTLQTLAGTEKVNGFEFGAQGRLTAHWEVIFGYTYLDPTAIGLVAAGVRGPIPNTAHNQANLWTTYDFDDGLKLGAGLNYIGLRRAGTDTLVAPGQVVTATVPGYATMDAMIGYQINDTFGLQLNGYNLTDTYYFVNSYFTKPGENHTVPGPGRTFLLTATASL
ncbi:MAG TPA: TonB-dependent siderophore receptor [Rhizomicrobium sp.]|jgi:catecholate siderophore receptor|nr:TonB-dependent siderophore receptor [Rhizomicrobium sp.]